MATAGSPTAVKRSVLRVIVLNFVSFGFYTFYWFYVVRKQLNEELGDKASLRGVDPLLQTIGPSILGIIGIVLTLVLIGLLILPVALILAVVVWYYFFKDLNLVRESKQLDTTPPILYILGYVALSFISPANLALIGMPAYYLNEYWDKRYGSKAQEAPYTAGEIAVSVLGIVIFVSIFMFFIGLGLLGILADQS